MTRSSSPFGQFVAILIVAFFTSANVTASTSLICSLDSPEVKIQDAHKAFAGVVEMTENLSFLRTARNILHSLDEIHTISKAEEMRNLDAMIQRGALRKLINASNGVSCIIPFDFAGAKVSETEMGYLGSFIATLDSINTTYKTRYQEDLGFEIAVFGYTDQSGSEAQNQVLAHARARNSAKILSALAKERGLNLKIVAVEGHPDQSPDGKNDCQENDAFCRACKITLAKMITK